MASRAVERPEYANRIVARLREQRERAIQEVTGGEALSFTLSDIMDRAILQMFEAVCSDVGLELDGSNPDGPALVILATGGYGRRELSPGSDIDIAFVPSEEGHTGLDEVVRRMYQLLMDLFTIGAGLKVGYAYRLIDDCDGLEHPTQTALVDARPVAGSVTLAHRFLDTLMEYLRPAAFAFHKDAERREAWAKHGGSVYAVEPNLKEGPGSLRDFQAAGWIARARYGIRGAQLWPELRGLGLITDRELKEALEARELLLSVRHQLHRLSGRQYDSLTAERQEILAGKLQSASDGPPPVIAFMRRLYHSMSVLHRTYGLISGACLDGPLALDRRLIVKRGQIHATDRDLLVDDSSAIPRIFHHFQEFGFRPAQELVELLASETRRGSVALQPEALTPLFLNLLGSDRAAAAIRLMADIGVLDLVLPEFASSRTLTPLNVIHRYTVGEHSLRTLEALESLPFTSDTSLSELRKIYNLVEHRDLLRLALLLHDIGKESPNQSHPETGASLARPAGERLGLDAEAVEMLEFLVRYHQWMSETAQLRDLTEGQTVRDFCAKIGSLERLRLLYLMTYADMVSTGSGVWTAVAGRFIEDLYLRSEAALLHGIPDPAQDPNFSGYRRRMKQELSLHNLPTEEVEAHSAQMPASYLLNTPMEEIAAHVRAIERLKTGSPVVDFFPGPGGQATVLTICAYDDPEPGLLSKIAAVLYANDIEIHAAQVFTREGEPPIAVDTVWTEFNGGELPPLKRRDLERDLLAVISGRTPSSELLKRRGKRIPTTAAPFLELRNDLSERHTVVEVDAADARGLLYRVTRAMSELGWDIHSARVSTLDGEARDAFYVTDSQGNKLPLDPEPLLTRMNAEIKEDSSRF